VPRKLWESQAIRICDPRRMGASVSTIALVSPISSKFPETDRPHPHRIATSSEHRCRESGLLHMLTMNARLVPLSSVAYRRSSLAMRGVLDASKIRPPVSPPPGYGSLSFVPLNE
jgi:hypothetical protein